MSNQNETNWYANVFKAWQVKLLGSKPTAEMLANIHKLNARPGKQALACAMALRPEGVTGAQIVIACGAPQLNKMRGYITDAILKRLPVPPSSEGHTVYKLELTAKGKQLIARTEARQAKALEAGKGDTEAAPKKAAAKATGKGKGKLPVKAAPKGKAPAKPASEPVKAPEPVAAPEATTAAPDSGAPHAA